MLAAPCSPPVCPRQTRRHDLARLGLAWLANMQVMMFAFPGYFRHQPMGADNLAVLERAVGIMNWVSLAMTLPVLAYCAAPIWRGAWRGLRTRPPGQISGLSMDVPVALGMVAAFVPSVVVTWTGAGEVYFESVTMFVAFVLSARYLQAAVQRGADSASSPATKSASDFLAPLSTRLSALAQRLALWFVLVQLGLAALVGAAWWLWSPAQALPVTVALLVMSCPCALAMAQPATLAAAHACVRRSPGLSEVAQQSLARATVRVTKQNLVGAIVWHALMVPLAGIGLVQPWLAAIAMLVSSLAVAANAGRLYYRLRPRVARPMAGAALA